MPPGILHHVIGWNIERKEIFVNDTNCSAFIADREFGLVEISLGSGIGAIMRLDKKHLIGALYLKLDLIPLNPVFQHSNIPVPHGIRLRQSR